MSLSLCAYIYIHAVILRSLGNGPVQFRVKAFGARCVEIKARNTQISRFINDALYEGGTNSAAAMFRGNENPSKPRRQFAADFHVIHDELG